MLRLVEKVAQIYTSLLIYSNSAGLSYYQIKNTMALSLNNVLLHDFGISSFKTYSFIPQSNHKLIFV